jgi:NAD(P)-dependent dehydrogenase (short-subunit alcohol dehydrogenase family)
VESRTVDLEDERAVLELVAEMKEASKNIDILVNNAGILRLTPFDELSTREWSQTLAINLTAPYLLIRAALPEMKELGGSIINVSSRAGVLGFKDESAYCTSKFGMEGLTRALAVELEEYPISINTVTPGLRIKPTSLSEVEFEKLPPENKAEWNDPEAITPAFNYLAGLRGEVSGLRFDAERLSKAINDQETTLTPEQTRELAE